MFAAEKKEMIPEKNYVEEEEVKSSIENESVQVRSKLRAGPSPLRHHLLAPILVKPCIHVNPNLVESLF